MGYIEGIVSTDMVTVNKESYGTIPFTFLNVNWAEDLKTLKGDGMVGLSAGIIGDRDHSLLVPYLYNSGQIPYNIFQLDLADKDCPSETSRVIFGGTSLYSNSLTWIPIVSRNHWTVSLDGTSHLPVDYQTKIIFDTGSTFSFIPQETYDCLIRILKSINPKCGIKGKHFVCPGDAADDKRYPVIDLDVPSWTYWSPKVNLPFGPK
jgi:hypothetical protein